MRFNELPLRLRLYILLQPLLLAPLVPLLQPEQRGHWSVTAILLVCTATFSTFKVPLKGLGTMSATFAVECLALLIQGGRASVLCAAAGALVGSHLRAPESGGRFRVLSPPAYQWAFNLLNCMLAAAAGALAFEGVTRAIPDAALATVLGLTAYTSLYFLVNTIGVSFAIALQQGVAPLGVWRQHFAWTAPGVFVSASAAAALAAAFRLMGFWSLLGLPPLLFIYYHYRVHLDRLRLSSEKMERDLEHIQELNRLNRAIISSLATAIDAKDRYTSSHINRVHHYALTLARRAGLDAAGLEAIATGALVHDIGKLGIPDHLLCKPGKLSPEEFERIKSHVTIGAEILSPVPFPVPVVDVVLTHHERWDGLGYPKGLKGEEIPIGGRIIGIVDVFDALTSDRPYRKALSYEQAVEILREGAGKQFDPNLVDLFIEALPQARAELEEQEAAQQAQADAVLTGGEADSAFARISQATAEVAAVWDVAQSLGDRETPQEVAAIVAQRSLSLLPVDTAVVYLRSEDGRSLACAAVEGKYGDKLRDMTIQMGEGAAGWVAERGQARINASAALDVARRFTPEETIELSAVTAVPIIQAERVLGVLAVYTLAYNLLSEAHLPVLNVLAEHTATALQGLQRLERNRELAYVDPMTGLANVRCLFRHLDRMGHSPDQDSSLQANDYSLVLLDVDGFKQVNDSLGHVHGDDLLRQLGQVLLDTARPGDVVCRYGGDEFVVLLPGTSRAQADRVAARLTTAVDELPPVRGKVKISASVGVASAPDDGDDGRTLIHVADRRMYEQKRGGPLAR